MNKFDELLKKGTDKLNAEKELAQKLIEVRVKTLTTFAKDIYEFIEYVNKSYKQHPYKEYDKTRMTDIFEFGNMDYHMEPKTFSTKEANKFAKIRIISYKLNNQIILQCDEKLNIVATIGYSNIKRFNTAIDLIEYLSYLIAKEKIEKN